MHDRLGTDATPSRRPRQRVLLDTCATVEWSSWEFPIACPSHATQLRGNGTDHMWGDRQVLNGIAASPTAPTGFVMTGGLAIIDTGADTRIAFDAANSVTLVGIGDPAVLQASDFIFA